MHLTIMLSVGQTVLGQEKHNHGLKYEPDLFLHGWGVGVEGTELDLGHTAVNDERS